MSIKSTGNGPTFTFAMDETLRAAVKASQYRKTKWEDISKLIPGTNAKHCKTRWEAIKPFPGLHHLAFAVSKPFSKKDTWVKKTSNKKKEKEKEAAPAPTKPLRPVREGGKDEEVVIHVCDETRKIKRDFKCERGLLTTGMKYFQAYLTDATSFEEIDISVHCDVNIFQWLMRHIKDEKKPTLDVGNVVSILISSDFLQMDGLVRVCLQYFKENASQIIKSPIDLNCISSKLLTQLAALFHNHELDAIKDKRDKMTSKLYARKLEAMLTRPENALSKCARCSLLYIESQREHLVCERAKVVVSHCGQVVVQHTPSSWDIKKHLTTLRISKMSWREVYWKLWGVVHHLRCSHCHKLFAACDLHHCSYHPNEGIFPPGDNLGFYPCCDSAARRLMTFAYPTGCMARTHKLTNLSATKAVSTATDLEEIVDVDTHLSQKAIYDLLQSYSELILSPFTPIISSRDGEADRRMLASSSALKLKRGASASLLSNGSDTHRGPFKQYSVGGGASGVDDEDVAVYSFGENRLARGEDGWLSESSECSDEGDASDESEEEEERPTSRYGRPLRREGSMRSSSGSRKKNGSPWISVSTSSKNTRRSSTSDGRRNNSDGRRIKRRPSSSTPSRSSDQRISKTVRMDAIREDDRKRMSSLVARLTSLRTSNDEQVGGNPDATLAKKKKQLGASKAR